MRRAVCRCSAASSKQVHMHPDALGCAREAHTALSPGRNTCTMVPSVAARGRPAGSGHTCWLHCRLALRHLGGGPGARPDHGTAVLELCHSCRARCTTTCPTLLCARHAIHRPLNSLRTTSWCSNLPQQSSRPEQRAHLAPSDIPSRCWRDSSRASCRRRAGRRSTRPAAGRAVPG